MSEKKVTIRPELFTLLNEDDEHQIEIISVDKQIFLSHEGLAQAVGWELNPEGLCREGMCIVVPTELRLESEFGLDLAKVAQLLQRPLVIDYDFCVGVLGTSAAVRAGKLSSLEAPDFTLPDLEGKLHSLSDYRGKKVLLVAYASW